MPFRPRAIRGRDPTRRRRRRIAVSLASRPPFRQLLQPIAAQSEITTPAQTECRSPVATVSPLAANNSFRRPAHEILLAAFSGSPTTRTCLRLRISRLVGGDSRYRRAKGDGTSALLSETARHLALWMTYEDAIRVADLKTRDARFDRVHHEVTRTARPTASDPRIPASAVWRKSPTFFPAGLGHSWKLWSSRQDHRKFA